MDPQTLVDYAASLDCIHCGLCLRTCPTYQLTGSEASSPRGRIYMMRGVAEGRLRGDEPAFVDEMDFCLGCRHCESVCPAGVRFGQMMETTRDGLVRTTHRPLLERALRWLGFRLVLPRRALIRLAFTCLALAQRTGLTRLFSTLRDLPPVPPRRDRAPLPEHTPADGGCVGQAFVLAGCVMPELYGRVNRATVRTLARLGVESRAPRGHTCCGALHAHNGDLAGARELARGTVEAFEGSEPIVVNSAGCGAHMKGYGHLLADDAAWRERAEAFAARVEDLAEFVAPRWQTAPPPPAPDLGTVTYDDPCHLCHGQKIRDEPRTLLDSIPGLERVELRDSESCCGSAGLYSMLRPADSRALLAPKLAALEASGADVLVTANPGCHMQWETGLRRAGAATRVMHLAELLDGEPAARRAGPESAS